MNEHSLQMEKPMTKVLLLLLFFLLPLLLLFTQLILKTMTSLKGFGQKHLLRSFSAFIDNDLFSFKILWHD